MTGRDGGAVTVRGRHRVRGFALVEVLVALVILAVGLSGSAALQLLAVRMGEEARWREQAVSETRAILDSLQLVEHSGTGSRTLGPMVLRWRTLGSEPRRTAEVVVLQDGEGGEGSMKFLATLH